MRRYPPLRPDAVTCMICGEPYNLLGPHLKARHGLGTTEYRERYGGLTAAPSLRAKHRENQQMSDQVGAGSWTAARIITVMQEYAARHGGPPTAPAWSRSRKSRGTSFVARADRPSTDTVRKVFGSWNAALEAAGLPTGVHKQYKRPKRCKNGHRRDDVYERPDGTLACRVCQRNAVRRYRARRQAGTRVAAPSAADPK